MSTIQEIEAQLSPEDMQSIREEARRVLDVSRAATLVESMIIGEEDRTCAHTILYRGCIMALLASTLAEDLRMPQSLAIKFGEKLFNATQNLYSICLDEARKVANKPDDVASVVVFDFNAADPSKMH